MSLSLKQKLIIFLRYLFAAMLAAVTPASLAALGLSPELVAIVMAGIGAALLHIRKPSDVFGALPARADALESDPAYDDGYAAGYEDAKRDFGPPPVDLEDAPDTLRSGGAQ